MSLHTKTLRGVLLASIAFLPATVWAQSATQGQPPSSASTTDVVEEVIVTGSARAARRFDVSYAVNALSQDQVQKLAPLNIADLLGKLPGIQVEPTGGEVQNVTRVRGIPTDAGYAYFQQDGLPLFHEIDGYFFRSADLQRYDLMTDRMEVVRGGPAPIYASQAAAIVNNVMVTGNDTTRGKAQLTLGTTGLYRLDAYQAGPISDKTYYAVGGFIRQDDGHRDNGFPNDRGGQIRANIKHDLDNGSIKVSVNYLNDSNLFYLPIPIADPRNPSVSLDKYIDYFDGTMNSPSLRNVSQKYRNGAGALVTDSRDLADGRHMEFGNVGLQYEGEFGGWLISAKGGISKGELNFDAFYSTSNPADATTFAAGFLPAATTAFGPGVSRLGYAVAGTSGAEAYNPAAASGLVMQGQYRAVGSKFYSTQGDLSVTRNFETGLGSHDVKAGVYGSIYGMDNLSVYQDYLIEVSGKPRTLDLVAYSSTGAVLGYVTDKGVLRYTTTLNQGDADAQMFAGYINDTWSITDKLRLDGGLRHERYSFDGYGLLSTSVNLGDSTTLADDSVRAFTGATQPHKLKPKVTNWTLGANYDFSSDFGAYVRASHLEVPPALQQAFTVNPTILKTKADQYEVGIKLTHARSYLYVTGFYTRFDPLNASFVAFNPATGRNDQSVPFFGKAIVKGAEMDGSLRLADWFAVNGSLTLQDPQYKSLLNSTGADPSQVEGNQIIREPKVFGNIRPNFTIETGGSSIDIYGSYEYTGKRYVDFFNNTALPSYGEFGAGVTLTHGDWRLQAVGDNLTNAHGLTEGNTRTDTLSGQGSKEAIYGRPIFGRSFRFVISKSW
jgi:outer membrane receptor protein involved in Fe transport